jgi:hypothetical protein
LAAIAVTCCSRTPGDSRETPSAKGSLAGLRKYDGHREAHGGLVDVDRPGASAGRTPRGPGARQGTARIAPPELGDGRQRAASWGRLMSRSDVHKGGRAQNDERHPVRVSPRAQIVGAGRVPDPRVWAMAAQDSSSEALDRAIRSRLSLPERSSSKTGSPSCGSGIARLHQSDRPSPGPDRGLAPSLTSCQVREPGHRVGQSSNGG